MVSHGVVSLALAVLLLAWVFWPWAYLIADIAWWVLTGTAFDDVSGLRRTAFVFWPVVWVFLSLLLGAAP